MPRPKLTYVLPDKAGGIPSYISNLLLHSRAREQFHTHAVLTHNPVIQETRCDGLPVDSFERFSYLPTENIYAVIKRLFKAIPPGPGVLVTNDWLELAMLSVHDPGRMVVNITHGDYDYYYDLARKHEGVIDCFVAPSQVIWERLCSALRHRRDTVFYFPHGVEIPKAVRSPQSAPLRAIYAGRLVQSKGVLDLPAIDDVLRRRNVAVAWTIVGDGPDAERARQSWAENASVKWMGRLPLDEVLQLYPQQDVLVLPSRAEGFPVTLAEAGAAGVVPVASDLPSGIPEIVVPEKTGYRVPVGDVMSFAMALEELNRDRDRLERMSAAVRQLVAEKFDIRRNAVQYDSLYTRFEELRRPRGRGHLHYGSRLDKPWLPNAFVRTVRSILGPRAH